MCRLSQMRLLHALEAVHSSLFDVTAFCYRGIKCVLTCPLWLQTYVSIVNRPAGIMSMPAIFYEAYGINITYDLLLIFPRLFDEHNCYILSKLCRKGMLVDLVKIHAQFEWPIQIGDDGRSNVNCAFRYACGNGHLNVAQWLYKVFKLTDDDVRFNDNNALTLVCTFGHLHVAQWLYTVFHLTVDDVRTGENYSFRTACAKGYLDMAKWLYSEFKLTVDDALSHGNDAFIYARRYEHQNVCDWLIATFGETVIA